jgi:hypothetical protein
MIVQSKPRMTIDEAGEIARRIMKDWRLDLTLPGLVVPVGELLPEM